MGKRKVIFFCLGVAFVLTAVVWAISREREPSYQGRTLSEWTDLLPGKNDDASNAIRHVGSNSLPVILKWLRYEPPSWKVKMVRPLGAVPDWVRPRFLVRWLVDKPAQARVGRSYRVLSILQEGAAPIAPELLRLSYDKSDVVPNRALQALGSMGTTGLPYLIRALLDPKHPHRVEAIRELGMVLQNKPAAMNAIQALFECSADKDEDVRVQASLTLADWSIQQPPGAVIDAFKRSVGRATNAFQAFIEFTADKDAGVRDKASITIAHWASQQPAGAMIDDFKGSVGSTNELFLRAVRGFEFVRTNGITNRSSP